MTHEMGERPPFIDGSRARYIAPSFDDMQGILPHVDSAVDGVLRTGHTLRRVSPHHGGSGPYYRLDLEVPVPTPIIDASQPEGLGNKIVEFFKPVIRSRTIVSSEVLLDRATR